jgi:DNA oxidative demethylase
MRMRWPRLRNRPRGAAQTGLHYDAGFLKDADRAELLAWLATLHPLWEYRFSQHRPVPEGESQRRLLRPVYWMGSWQFACLDYYRPPKGALNRAIRAEPYPPVMARLVREIEGRTRKMFRGGDLPADWALTTCLINFYGRRKEGDKWVDTARVGEHKDFEPGPVASLSLGERALFQFVTSRRPGERDGVVSQQWLDDGALQIFGGDQWKRQTFHRVQRVDKKEGHRFELQVPDFETRRVNFTFRFVPEAHVVRFAQLPPEAQRDVEGYVRTLAEGSPFFAGELAAAGG